MQHKIFTLSLFAFLFTSVNVNAQCSATITNTANPNGAHSFTATNVVGAGFFTNYYWVFDDGTVEYGPTVTHLYLYNGTYEVCFTMEDSASNCNFRICDSVVVTNTNNPPACDVTITFTNIDSLYHFEATPTSPNPVTFNWTLDGGPQTAGTSGLDLIFTAAGVHTLCVEAMDANGCVSSACATFTVINGNPSGSCTAYFVIYPDSSQPGVYLCDNRSTGSYTNILWDFGDGASSTLTSPSHLYAQPGQYTICVTVSALNTFCNDTYCDSSFLVFKTDGGLMSQLIVTGPAAVAQVEPLTWSMVPNPVHDVLNIKLDKLEEVKITNLNGQLVFASKAGNGIYNLQSLPVGLYIVEATAGAVTYRDKLVKQ